MGELGLATVLEGGVDSLSIIDPPREGATTGGLDRMTLVLHKEWVEPGEDSFIWSHLVDPCKALFIVNNTAK